MNFILAYLYELFLNLFNNYENNFDFYRFKKIALKNKNTNSKKHKKKFIEVIRMILCILKNLNGLNAFYKILTNKKSKKLLVKLLTFKTLGFKKVKLYLNTDKFWEDLKKIDKLKNEKDFIQIDFLNWKLNRFQIMANGNEFNMYYVNFGINQTFFLEQYAYYDSITPIEAIESDFVIDAGGCYGDTALYFANKVKEKGRVFVFEFVPKNISVLKKNLSLNQKLKKNVQLIEKAVWNKSNEILYYNENGPGSSVVTNNNPKSSFVHTITIDDFVQANQIIKIDFIKMDIEGVELQALKGAVETIKAYKPKLAISLYHHFNDMLEIPKFLDSLRINYKFYLGHYTIHNEETILFARVE